MCAKGEDGKAGFIVNATKLPEELSGKKTGGYNVELSYGDDKNKLVFLSELEVLPEVPIELQDKDMRLYFKPQAVVATDNGICMQLFQNNMSMQYHQTMFDMCCQPKAEAIEHLKTLPAQLEEYKKYVSNVISALERTIADTPEFIKYLNEFPEIDPCYVRISDATNIFAELKHNTTSNRDSQPEDNPSVSNLKVV